MPKIEIDYSNTVIYKIMCNDTSCKKFYVGHTTNFVQRKHSHKQSCTNEKSSNYNLEMYKTIRENGGWENWRMVIIHVAKCKNGHEAKKIENEFFELLNDPLNTNQILPKQNLKTEKMVSCKKPGLYTCTFCSYNTSVKSNYEKHILTPKHQDNIKTEKNENDKCIKCKNCNKTYKTRSGLWYHEKTCVFQEVEKEPPQEDNFDFKNMFMDLMKQNEEFKKIMLEQNAKMLELANNQSVTNNNNTINNTMNNKFNLQIFLNETCKDAMNIQEFIDYVKVQHSDFENFGKYGYVESMTRIIMRNLMELEVHRRPIHCTDVKREVLYVKDNDVWVNDFSREKLIRAIKYIAAKNVKQIPGWMDNNPDSKNTQTKLHDKYMRMVCYSMGGRDEAEDQEYYKKIIHNVAKEVVIDKMR